MGCAPLVITQKIQTSRIKHIRVIIHVFNRSDGTGNFQPRIPRDSTWLSERIQDANKFLSDPEPNQPEHGKPVVDTYIRMRLLGIKYWNNDTAFEVRTNTRYNHRNLFLDYVRNNPKLTPFERDSCLHILLSGVRPRYYGGRNICLESGCNDGLGFANNVLYFEGMYYVYLDTIKFGEVGGHMVHELGHGLGLPHYNFEHIRFDAAKGGIKNPCYPCEAEQPCEWRSGNNFMKSTEGGHGMTQCQVDYMHKLMEGGPAADDAFYHKSRAHWLWEYRD